jgi:hypothetical protein
MPPVEPSVEKPTSTDTLPSANGAAPAAPSAKPLAKPSLVARFKTLALEYGPLALVIHYALFFLTVGGFFVAFKLGFKAESTGATAGTFAAAYVASQAVKPFRLAAVFALTPMAGRIPFVSRLLKRFWQKDSPGTPQ